LLVGFTDGSLLKTNEHQVQTLKSDEFLYPKLLQHTHPIHSLCLSPHINISIAK